MKLPFLILTLSAVLLGASDASEWRALVIGNGAYPGKPLANPVSDAKLISGTLKSVGFQTTVVTDANLKSMRKAVREFGDSLRPGDVALFYYAGHGAQMNGENYLFPVDAPEEIREFEAEDSCFKTGVPLAAMSAAGSGLNIVILDCCRNNPFARSWRSGGNAGLTEVRAPQETLIAFATAPGKVALDGVDSGNSPFARALATQISQSERKIQDVFLDVARSVYAETRGEQRPWVSHDILTEFTFTKKAARDSAPVASAPRVGLPATDAGHDPAALALFKEKIEGLLARLPKPSTKAPASEQISYLRAMSRGFLDLPASGLPADMKAAFQDVLDPFKEINTTLSMLPENFPADASDAVKRPILIEVARKNPSILSRFATLGELEEKLAPALARLEKILNKYGIRPTQITR